MKKAELNKLIENTVRKVLKEFSEAEDFEQGMIDKEEKVKEDSSKSQVWNNYEKETGDLWRELGVDNWSDAFKKDPMACYTYKEQLNNLTENKNMKSSELNKLIESIVRKQISNCRLNERIVPKFKKSKNSIPENERKLSAKYLALYNFGFENFVKKYGSISKAYKIANQELEDEGDWTLDYIQASDGYWDMYDRIIKGDDYVFNIWNALDNRYKK